MYGLEPGSFDGTYQSWRKLLHPDDWPSVKAAIERANETGDVAAEYRIVHKDGTVHWVRAKGRMFFNPSRQPERMVGFMFDVTDWRHAEEALRASEERFRTVFDRAMDAFFLLDTQLNVVDANRQACDSLGRSREELIGMHPRNFDVDLDEAFLRRLAERSGPGVPLTFETRHRRKDGAIFPVEVRTGTFRQDGTLCYLALARTSRNASAPRKLCARARPGFRTFVDRATDAFFLMDEQPLSWTSTARPARAWATAARNWSACTHASSMPAWTIESIELLAERAGAGETITFETLHRRRDGTVFPVEIRSGTFKRRRAAAVHCARARHQRAQAGGGDGARQGPGAGGGPHGAGARVAGDDDGELTASIAHEVNQPLGGHGCQRRGLGALAFGGPTQRGEGPAGAREHYRRRPARERSHPADPALVQRRPPRMDLVGVNDTIGDVIALARQELRSNSVVCPGCCPRTCPPCWATGSSCSRCC